MSLSRYPKLQNFFSTVILDADPEQDSATLQTFSQSASESDQSKIATELKSLLDQPEISLEDLGTEANRWFADEGEARAWLETIKTALESSASADAEMIVLDSNGARLQEGDSVTVIKDLKVKGGSSDLKRGTLIKKIHLTSDPKMIECKVDGSVLVLKTEFLKKG